MLRRTNVDRTAHQIPVGGDIRQVCRNVRRWRNTSMAGRWTGAAILEAKKCFRRLKANKQLPILKEAFKTYRTKPKASRVIDHVATAA